MVNSYKNCKLFSQSNYKPAYLYNRHKSYTKMSTNLEKSESKFMERARTALANASNHPEIKTALADYGMDDKKLAEGNKLYTNTKNVWEMNKKEDTESSVALNSYKGKYNEFSSLFKRHRNQTLIYFKKQPDILITLGVKGRFPAKYNDFFDKVGQFYKGIKNNAAIQTQMDLIKVTSSIVNKCLTLLKDLLAERSNYDKELSESQDATKSKDAALLELKEWMEDFDAIAKVALYDNPQLLESLGIFVRS